MYVAKLHTNVIQKSCKYKISLEKHGMLYKKLPVKILNLIHKYICNKHDIILMYIYRSNIIHYLFLTRAYHKISTVFILRYYSDQIRHKNV